MAEITWIKLKTDMFENEKIKLLEALPDADTIIVIWVKLLATAGKSNCNGYIMLTENIPMNEEEMATIFNRPLNTVRLALQTFNRYGMIEVEDSAIRIKNWEAHQNIEGMERVKQLNRERVKRHRERKRNGLIQAPEIEEKECNVTATFRNATDIDKELDIDIDKEKNNKLKKLGNQADISLPYQTIIEYLNQTAGTNYRCTTKKTQQLIKARYNEGFTAEDFKTVIHKKSKEWLLDSRFSKYLRPETLFGTKFESYLNEKVGEKNENFNKQSPREYSDGVNF